MHNRFKLKSAKLEAELATIKAKKKVMDNLKLLRVDDPFFNADKKFIIKNSNLKSDKEKEKEAEIVVMMQNLQNEARNKYRPITASLPAKLSKSTKSDREQKDQDLATYTEFNSKIDKLYNKLQKKGFKEILY